MRILSKGALLMKYIKKTLALIFMLSLCLVIPIHAYAEDGWGATPDCQHSWGEWFYSTYDDEPACDHGGVETRQCSLCGTEETRAVPPLTHEWTKWRYEENPTCGDTGMEYRCCNICNMEETRIVPATGKHVWGSWKTATASTVFKKGKAVRKCTECGKAQTKALARVKPFAKFGKKSYSVAKKKTLKLAKKLKFGKGDKVVKWQSSNKKIATVSAKGVIKARKKGTVKITARLKSGKVATCKIKVTKVKKKKSSGGKVYWVPSGKVYHCTRDCPTLSRSRVIKSGSLSKCPKPRKCKVCY